MNYQKIRKICKKAKRVYIIEQDGQQWVGSGREIYAVEGMPILSGDQMCRFLGLEPEETSIITPGAEAKKLPLDDADETEEIVSGGGLKCCIAGREAVVFFHGAGRSVQTRSS